jgi:hypothetical protein
VKIGKEVAEGLDEAVMTKVCKIWNQHEAGTGTGVGKGELQRNKTQTGMPEGTKGEA